MKARLAELLPALPEGVSIRSVYDRSELILRAIANLKRTLIEESLIVAFVCVVFLLHIRSALVAILNDGWTGRIRTPVFGCSLSDPEMARQSEP